MTLSRRMATALATTFIATGVLFSAAGTPAQAAPARPAFGCTSERLAVQFWIMERNKLGRELNDPTSPRSQEVILADIAFAETSIDLARAAYDECITDQGGGGGDF